MAKRKTSPQLAVAIGTRRKMPQLSVTAPTTPDTRSLMELDASYSPLLGLPEDIRRMIWREVFGVAQSVHLYNQELPVRPIGHNGNYDFVRLENSPLRPGLNHFRCLATRSDHEYYNESKGYDDDLSLANGLPRYDMPCRDVGCNHRDCYVSPRTTCINLSGFQTCRQMYLESTNVLYSSTSFCFSDKKTFLAFCSSLTPLQRIMLRKIHISSHEILDEKDWHSYPKESQRSYEYYRSISKDFSSDNWIDRLLQFRILSLTNATVVCSDNNYGPTYRAMFPNSAKNEEVQSQYRWTIQEREILQSVSDRGFCLLLAWKEITLIEWHEGIGGVLEF